MCVCRVNSIEIAASLPYLGQCHWWQNVNQPRTEKRPSSDWLPRPVLTHTCGEQEGKRQDRPLSPPYCPLPKCILNSSHDQVFIREILQKPIIVLTPPTSPHRRMFGTWSHWSQNGYGTPAPRATQDVFITRAVSFPGRRENEERQPGSGSRLPWRMTPAARPTRVAAARREVRDSQRAGSPRRLLLTVTTVSSGLPGTEAQGAEAASACAIRPKSIASANAKLKSNTRK